MKRNILIAISIMLLAGQAMAQKVSVYVSGNITAEQKSLVEDRFVDQLTKVKSVAMLERAGAMLRALQLEEDYQLSGEVAEEEIVRLCQKKGAEYVVAVKVTNSGDMLYMSVRMVDVETGQALHSVNQERENRGRKELTAMSNKAAYLLAEKIKGPKF